MNPHQTAVERIEAALKGVADALATADLEGLLAAEAVLGDALGQLGVTAPLEESGRAELREAIDRAYAMLLRCRRLGAGLTAFARAAIHTAPRYGPSGLVPEEARTTSVEMRG
jgi:hypothetical protein